ncbi:MAG: aldo/keto reductase, partial [Nitrososphaerota archaeon]
MQYVNLGKAGVKVSRICLGALNFGNEREWMVDYDGAKKVFEKAWDLGINFYDTANVYSRGRSEEILGMLLEGRREDAVVATKVFGRMGEGPNDRGLSRKHIMWQARESLRRLRTDYIDLYQIHRWDYETPIEETLATLTDLVRMGKILYIGASSMWAWQFTKAIYISRMKGYEEFVSMQNVYNLLYREEEREMIPFCKSEGIAIIPWSPLAVGVISGKYLVNNKLVVTEKDLERIRPGTNDYNAYIAPPENGEIVRRVVEVASTQGVTPSQSALAWLCQQGVTAPV